MMNHHRQKNTRISNKLVIKIWPDFYYLLSLGKICLEPSQMEYCNLLFSVCFRQSDYFIGLISELPWNKWHRNGFHSNVHTKRDRNTLHICCFLWVA